MDKGNCIEVKNKYPINITKYAYNLVMLDIRVENYNKYLDKNLDNYPSYLIFNNVETRVKIRVLKIRKCLAILENEGIFKKLILECDEAYTLQEWKAFNRKKKIRKILDL